MENNLLIKNINDLKGLLSVTKFLHWITLSYEFREKPSLNIKSIQLLGGYIGFILQKYQ